MNKLEKTYGRAVKTAIWFIKPFKRIFIRTLCEVHIFINEQALEILKNDGYTEAYVFFDKYRKTLNDGVVWADQDFRSREHFYNPYNHKGLYGCKSSKQRFTQYYGKALVYWDGGDHEKAIFYLGAAVHLIQDSTIPQHGNVNLLKSHRSYERWVKEVHDDFLHYTVKNNGVYLDNPYCYIDCNSKKSIEAYRRYALIRDNNEKYFKIANSTFPTAQRTTAGCLLNFYNTVNETGKDSGNGGMEADCECEHGHNHV